MLDWAPTLQISNLEEQEGGDYMVEFYDTRVANHVALFAPIYEPKATVSPVSPEAEHAGVEDSATWIPPVDMLHWCPEAPLRDGR